MAERKAKVQEQEKASGIEGPERTEFGVAVDEALLLKKEEEEAGVAGKRAAAVVAADNNILEAAEALGNMEKSYTVLLESKEPLIHKLLDQQEKLIREFLVCFLMPEAFNDLSIKKICELDLAKNLQPKSDFFLGRAREFVSMHPKSATKEATAAVADTLKAPAPASAATKRKYSSMMDFVSKKARLDHAASQTKDTC
nr:hypothetical protein BaRGS_007122 [Batillaria attramentaria]